MPDTLDKYADLCYIIVFFKHQSCVTLKPFCANWEVFLLFSGGTGRL
jgi:hypothetical protein